MKTQKVKQILLGLIVPVLILAAWICATHFREHSHQYPAENFHGVAGISGDAAKRTALE